MAENEEDKSKLQTSGDGTQAPAATSAPLESAPGGTKPELTEKEKRQAQLKLDRDRSMRGLEAEKRERVRAGQTVNVFEFDALEVVSRLLDTFFKLNHPAYTEGISDWNFPHAVGDRTKRHKVGRRYANGVFVDVFNAETPQAEIDRIKAHMDTLGHRYTYVKGGEDWKADDYGKLVFEERLKPSGKKVKVPTNLTEAGMLPVAGV